MELLSYSTLIQNVTSVKVKKKTVLEKTAESHSQTVRRVDDVVTDKATG